MEPLTQDSTFLLVLFLVMLWTLPWKGYALWVAARRSDKWWFIALLILNTLAILEIVYIFFIAKKEQPETTTSDSQP